MKKNTAQTQTINRISRQESLPLLRGMFVVPELVPRKSNPVQKDADYACHFEDGLVLTAEQCAFLGE
jgi:hypothetical protein